MQIRRVLPVLLLCGAGVLVGGCIVVAAGAGAGTVAYVTGSLEAVESKNVDVVYKATEKAAGELGLVTTEKTKDALSAKIIARDAQDKKIAINLKALAEESTKVSVRVGFWGDEVKSRLIYKKIQDNLK
jgi:hypothetical protein